MAACAFYVAVLVPAFFARRTLGPEIGRPLFLLVLLQGKVEIRRDETASLCNVFLCSVISGILQTFLLYHFF